MFHQYVESKFIESLGNCLNPNEKIRAFAYKIEELENRVRHNQKDISDFMCERVQILNLSNPTDEEYQEFLQSSERVEYLLAENRKTHDDIAQLRAHIDNEKADQDMVSTPLSVSSDSDSEDFAANVFTRSNTFP